MSQQLDRSKPLWEIWVVDGLEDNRWAMLSKTHHALVDGVAGTDLLAVIMDLSPDAAAARAPVASGRRTPSRPGLELVVEAMENMVRSPYEQLRAARAQTRVWCGRRPATSGEVASGVFALSGLVRPHAALEPERAARPAPPLRLGDDVGRGHQGRAQGARGHVQRRRARLHHQRLPRAPAVPGRGHRAGRAHAGPGVGAPPRRRRARRSATARSRTRSPPCSPSCRSRSRTR